MIASVPAIVSYVLWISILLQVKYTLTITGILVITGTSTLVKILSNFDRFQDINKKMRDFFKTLMSYGYSDLLSAVVFKIFQYLFL